MPPQRSRVTYATQGHKSETALETDLDREHSNETSNKPCRHHGALDARLPIYVSDAQCGLQWTQPQEQQLRR